MKCSKCGFENKPETKFCESCGNKLKKGNALIIALIIIPFVGLLIWIEIVNVISIINYGEPSGLSLYVKPKVENKAINQKDNIKNDDEDTIVKREVTHDNFVNSDGNDYYKEKYDVYVNDKFMVSFEKKSEEKNEYGRIDAYYKISINGNYFEDINVYNYLRSNLYSNDLLLYSIKDSLILIYQDHFVLFDNNGKNYYNSSDDIEALSLKRDKITIDEKGLKVNKNIVFKFEDGSTIQIPTLGLPPSYYLSASKTSACENRICYNKFNSLEELLTKFSIEKYYPLETEYTYVLKDSKISSSYTKKVNKTIEDLYNEVTKDDYVFYLAQK